MTAAEPRLDVDATRERLPALRCGHAADRLAELLAGDAALAPAILERRSYGLRDLDDALERARA